MPSRLRWLVLSVLRTKLPHAVTITAGVAALRRCSLADARALPFPKGIHDAVLELGLRDNDDVF